VRSDGIPFGGDTMEAILMKHLHSTPARPSERLGAPLPRDLEDVLLACLSKDPEQRPQTGADLRRALDDCEDAGQWSQAVSRSWWAEREEEPGQGAGGGEPEQDTVQDSGMQSITVDWQRRLQAPQDEERTIQENRGDRGGH